MASKDGTKELETIINNESLSDTERFALLNRLILRDLNRYQVSLATFPRYTKDDIAKFLASPYRYRTNLVDIVNYIYGASSHFRRLIQYFTSLSDLSYVVLPYKIDPKKANVRITNNNYRKVLDYLASMSIKTQFPKILTVCLREDVFYGTVLRTKDSVTIQQLPTKYCLISTIEGNVMNVSFDFSYFNSRLDLLEYYPEEFKRKYYDVYKKDIVHSRWIELDSPYSFAIKCNVDIPEYPLPPFAGILREIYDLEDYKNLKLTRTALENYALVTMQIPTDDEGHYLIDYDKAKAFWMNLDSVLPEEVGSVLTPMELSKIDFEKSNTGDTDTITNAEDNLYSSAGVSALLFNNTRASANALALSIKVDQALTFGIVKSIQDMVNRLIQHESYGKNFKVEFLDVSPFNRKEAGEAYLKACQYGIPMISFYCASQGLGQAEMDSMSFLETEVLELQKMFKPLVNSNTIGTDAIEEGRTTERGGAPKKSDTELTETGEETREQGEDWR